LIDEYIELRRKLNLGDGWFSTTTPHLNYSVIRDICCFRELHYLLVDLLGEEMGLTFSLNGFKSSERGWHQDDYLNLDGPSLAIDRDSLVARSRPGFVGRNTEDRKGEKQNFSSNTDRPGIVDEPYSRRAGLN
jgi:hypothetical protein